MKGLRITMGILVIAWLIFSTSLILAREIPYTQEDRDRKIRELEEKVERLERALKEFGYQDERLANIFKKTWSSLRAN